MAGYKERRRRRIRKIHQGGETKQAAVRRLNPEGRRRLRRISTSLLVDVSLR